MDLPENFTEAMESINILKLNPVQLMNLGCLSSGFDFHAKLVVTTLLPLIICAVLVVVGRIKKKLRGVMDSIILVVLYAVLPSVSTTVFGAFPCDELDTGEKFLIADYAINCDESSYSLFAAYAGVMMVVYPIGVPVLYGWLLVRKKEHITQPVAEREEDNELAGLAFLFDQYKPKYWYFEVVVTVLRLLLTGVLGLIEPGSATQLCVGMIITFGAVMQLCDSKPYENGRDSVLSILGYVQIFLVMLCALMMKVQAFAEGVDKEMLGVLLILVNMMVLLTALAVMAVSFFRNQEDDYQSENPLAILNREVGNAKEKANEEGLEMSNFGRQTDELQHLENPLHREGEGERWSDKLRHTAKAYGIGAKKKPPMMPSTSFRGVPPPAPTSFTSPLPPDTNLS